MDVLLRVRTTKSNNNFLAKNPLILAIFLVPRQVLIGQQETHAALSVSMTQNEITNF